MANEIVVEKLRFSKSLVDLINKSPLPSFVIADILASAHGEILKSVREEDEEALQEIQNADSSVSDDGSTVG